MVDIAVQGQSFHLSIPYAAGADLAARFGRCSEARYGYVLPAENKTEVVNVRLSVSAPREPVSFPRPPASGTPEPIGMRTILQPSGWLKISAFLRSTLPAGFALAGPAIIEDEGTTIYVPGDFSVAVEESGCLRVERE